MSWNKSYDEVAIPHGLVIFGSFKVLRCQFGTCCLSFQSILIKLDVKIHFFYSLTTVISWLPWLFIQVKGVSPTFELVGWATSDLVNSVIFAMWARPSRWFPSELVPWSEGWQQTWWQMRYTTPGMPASWIRQCNYLCHAAVCCEIFQARGHCEPTFIESHQAPKVTSKVRSLKVLINKCQFLEEI